ncbi:MAG: FliA/WhiG family RNA polymerase sigma factor [Planctomycetes bacterium]|nr:FliA/WhiG family RNA polymerase sigma factor [Planctomycetota bacterium]
MKTGHVRAAKEQVAKWWMDFKKQDDHEAKNLLLEHYLPIVKYTAERMRTKLPDEVDVDDLISAGIFGLMDAVKAFDMNRGVKFETYCTQRIRGAILDELRSMDWVPRLVRNRSHRVGNALHSLEAQLGRKPNERELAEKLRIGMGEFRKINRDSKAASVVSLSKKWFETDSHKDVREIDVLEDRRSEDPFMSAHRKDLKDLITRGLSRAERLIVILYYFEEMTMKEIGQTLALSESRVSQMHSAIMGRLRSMLARRQRELEAV